MKSSKKLGNLEWWRKWVWISADFPLFIWAI